MDVKRQVKWMSGALLSTLVALAMPAQAEPTDKQPQLITGPIGKTSSASARITLIIPPRPDKKKQTSNVQKNATKPAEKKEN